MKQKINLSWSKEILDSFLIEKFGHGILEFELCLIRVYMTYFYNKMMIASNLAQIRIDELEDLKKKILEMIDDFLLNTNFYKNCSKTTLGKTATGIEKWTTKNRKIFIIKNFKLEQLFSIIDKLKQSYIKFEIKYDIDGPLWSLESPMYLKPINFLILVWSYAMKSGSKVDWINMENLLLWFSNNLDEPALIKFFNLDKRDEYPAEILRFTRNKYKKANITKKHILFIKIFLGH